LTGVEVVIKYCLLVYLAPV